MKTTEDDIRYAIALMQLQKLAPIVKHYNGFIILAQSDGDYMTKENAIRHGDTKGFYTVQQALLSSLLTLDLKPCPFCGGKAITNRHWVYCEICGATVDGNGLNKSINAWETRKDATEDDLRNAFSAGRTVINYKGTWEETYNDDMTSAAYPKFEDWYSGYVKQSNQRTSKDIKIETALSNVIPIEVEDFIAKATALLEGLVPSNKRHEVIKLGNRLLDKYDSQIKE